MHEIDVRKLPVEILRHLLGQISLT